MKDRGCHVLWFGRRAFGQCASGVGLCERLRSGPPVHVQDLSLSVCVCKCAPRACLFFRVIER